MARPMSRDAAEAALRLGGSARGEALRRLPDDVDPELVAGIVLDAARQANWWGFARACRRLPEPVVRRVLAGLETSSSSLSVFVRESIRLRAADASLASTWDDTLGALLDLDCSYAWGSKQRRDKLAKLAGDRRFLGACQAASSGCELASLPMLAVLAVDGSDTSIDALMPQFVHATESKGTRLDRLERLRTHARDTPAMRAMLREIEELLGARKASSPALALAGPIGLGSLEELWFHAYFFSAEDATASITRFQANVDVDSRRDRWFAVHIHVSTQQMPGEPPEGISFELGKVHRDTFGIGPCAPEELPTWLSRLARDRGFAWDFQQAGMRTGLRGKKRDAVLGWLRSG